MASNDTPFTPGFKEVMRQSRNEAGRLGHDYIGPEHFLLGIIRKGEGLAVQVLLNMDVDPGSLQAGVEARMKPGRGDENRAAVFPQNPAAKKVIDNAREIARGFKHNWVGTEHLLLALIKTEGTIPCDVLKQASLEFGRTREEVLNIIEGASSHTYGGNADDLPPFTPELKAVVHSAREDAKQRGHGEIRTEHYLLAILRADEGIAILALKNLGANSADLINDIEKAMEPRRGQPAEIPEDLLDVDRALGTAPGMALGMRHLQVGPEHLLLSIIVLEDSTGGKILKKAGVTLDNAIAEVMARATGPSPLRAWWKKLWS